MRTQKMNNITRDSQRERCQKKQHIVSMSLTCLIFGAAVYSPGVYSTDLQDNDLIIFAPDTPVNSGDFNFNFENIKNTINSKQDKLSVTCTAGQYVQQINDDGTFTCQPDQVGSGGGGGVTGVVSQDASGVSATTNVSGVVSIELNNDLLNNNAINALKATDGSGSTLDADLLDGRNSSDFASSNQNCTANQAVSGVDATGNINCINHITEITSASTLTGGGTAGSINLEVDTAVIQRRVTGTCPSGSSIRTIDPNGNVACETDDDNGINDVIAGDHLSKSGPIGSPTIDVVGMPGIAFLQDQNAVSISTGSMQTINSMSITPPSSGWILVNATVSINCGDGYGGFIPADMQITNSTTGASTPIMQFTARESATVFSASYVFQVNKQTNNLNLTARCTNSGSGQIRVHSLNAVYFSNRLN